MNKRSKAIIILLSISLFILGYLAVTSRSIRIKEVQSPKKEAPKVDQAKLRQDYQAGSKTLVMEYESILDQVKVSADLPEAEKEKWSQEAGRIKSSLMDLSVPSDMRDYHIKLVLSIDRLEAYLKDKDAAEIKASEKLLDEASHDASQLN